MHLYLISYDLRRARNYGGLYELLAYWGARKLLESVWLADLAGPANVIRDIIVNTCDADDGIAVIELHPPFEWATMGVDRSAVDRLLPVSAT